MGQFAARLADAVRRKGPLCVGLDPRWESLPKSIRDQMRDADPEERAAVGYFEFCRKVLELVRPYCGVVKPQAAFFEQVGPNGLEMLQLLLREAKLQGFVTIL